MLEDHRILILDFGSQYTQLIARRIRQLRVYCEIHPHTMSAEKVQEFAPKAIVLSGGPSSVYDDNAPDIDGKILEMDVPMLGICYGLQLLAHRMGGKVVPSKEREYGRAHVRAKKELPPVAKSVLAGFGTDPFDVWMSHGDRIETLPKDFVDAADTDNTPYAVIAHKTMPILGFQFHPEVTHTPRGIELLEAFVFEVAGMSPTWTMESFLEEQIALVQKQVGPHDRVICGLSGGVDSSVVAALLHRALGDRLQCIFVDNGLLRRGEFEQVQEVFGRALKVNLKGIDAREEFLTALKGVSDPERKRKIIGHTFIDVFEREARTFDDAKFLAQGTLYPDVIESVSATGGPSVTIKSHHNVGGLPERMKLELIEPLRELFKDEVRLLGAELGIPHHMCQRHPFPGPGLAVRCLTDLTAENLEVLRHADAIFIDELTASGWYDRCWQTFAVLLPVRSVGVMGDERTYEQTIVLRSVDSVDGMTADWSRLPYDLLARVSNRIINEVRGVNRVVYDVSSKPPATIEWE